MGRLIKKKDDADPERVPSDAIVELGQWYWVKDREEEWLGCVTELGSNYAGFEGPSGHNSTHIARIHLNEFDKECRRELDPEGVIRGKIGCYQGVVQAKLLKIREITARLGLAPTQKIEQATAPSSRALAVLSGTDNVKKYKRSLVRAKSTTLPKLFKEMEEAHEMMAVWMGAQALPMRAMTKSLEGCVEKIEDRIFNVSLYAGLSEDVFEISEGTAARADEKVHLFQRRLYMDEECLLDYRHGGMEFGKIKDFDKWIATPANRDRILPFPRSMVAFRVRRETKERDWGGSLGRALLNFRLEEMDKITFFYLRNGDRLHRMNCDQEFDQLIFPSENELNLGEPMMASQRFSEIKLLPLRSYKVMKKHHDSEVSKYKAWAKAHPKKSWVENPHSDHGWGSCGCTDWEPFDKENVYFDEIEGSIQKRVQYYNRIALILQGLFDRSMVFHPHPPYRLWDSGGFDQAVKLVYDGANVLNHGAPPDFRAYQTRCNATLKTGSVTIGQDGFWTEHEAAKENARLDRGWRTVNYRHERLRPQGNPGPGYIAKIHKWSPRAKRATFKWDRQRQYSTWSSRRGELLPTTVSVPTGRLFNVDAYKPGDYKQFFADPRTRAQYLQWAPMLLAAEEYHAGNLKVGSRGRGPEDDE